MSDLSIEVAQFLEDSAIGTQGTDIFITEMPDEKDGSVDDAVSVMSTGGFEPDPDIGDDVQVPTVQIMVRDNSYATGSAKIHSIHVLMIDVRNTTLSSGGKHVYFTNGMQEPTYLGKDDKDRNLFSCNYRFIAHR